ncbi:MAG: 3'(2'),5'-bisphosphate nucleotidase CysQ [Rickettsiales bacterium]|nr:3'(2'),5'-bisphosphate nucleotidase CysQ [Rickettsiales bacterium]|tara:strand:- start:5112 stop:5894 length:783 start_codon:yes stop_codon:yes gene_type:complete
MISFSEIEFIKKTITLAGKKTLDFQKENLKIEFKEDESPLTNADLISNEVIVSNLKSKFNSISIISEENKNRIVSDYFFLIDPLDGTKEFIKGSAEFTVNIALIKNKKPCFGFIYIPRLNKIFWNDKNKSFVEINKKKKVIECRNCFKVLDIEISKSHMDKKTEKFVKNIKFGKVNRIGSSLKICNIAEGKSNIYPRFGKTMEWDIAAGHSILKKAGGEIFSTSLLPLAYGKKNFLNESFIAIGGREIPKMIIKKFTSNL